MISQTPRARAGKSVLSETQAVHRDGVVDSNGNLDRWLDAVSGLTSDDRQLAEQVLLGSLAAQAERSIWDQAQDDALSYLRMLRVIPDCVEGRITPNQPPLFGGGVA